jgi:excisionase family DNA binding protein
VSVLVLDWLRLSNYGHLMNKQRDPQDTSGPSLTIPQTARALGCGRSTVYSLIRSGKLRSFHVGKLRRVTQEAIAELRDTHAP